MPEPSQCDYVIKPKCFSEKSHLKFYTVNGEGLPVCRAVTFRKTSLLRVLHGHSITALHVSVFPFCPLNVQVIYMSAGAGHAKNLAHTQGAPVQN